jgi:hypothetical protein
MMMTEKALRVVSLIDEIDEVTSKMNALQPAPADSDKTKEWTKLFDLRHDKELELDDAADAYLAECHQTIGERWDNCYKDNRYSADALHTLKACYDREAISLEEMQVISKPLERNLNHSRMFTIQSLLKQLEEEESSKGEKAQA